MLLGESYAFPLKGFPIEYVFFLKLTFDLSVASYVSSLCRFETGLRYWDLYILACAS